MMYMQLPTDHLFKEGCHNSCDLASPRKSSNLEIISHGTLRKKTGVNLVAHMSVVSGRDYKESSVERKAKLVITG